MRHRKTPVILLREKADRLQAEIIELHAKLDAANRWAAYQVDQHAKRINADQLRMQKERNASER